MSIADRNRERPALPLDRNHFVESIASAFEILELFSRSTTPLSFSEIARQSKKPKGSVHRVLSTLVHLGVLSRTRAGEYKLTFKLWGVGMTAFAGMDLARIAQPSVEALMRAVDETAHVAILDGADCVTYLCKAESLRSIRVQFWIGKRVPSWRSATGRSMLAFLPDTADQLMKDLRAHGDKDGDSIELTRILSRIRRAGYAITRGDNHPEMGGIAAPVRDYSGGVVASCGIAIPKFRMTRQLVQQCVPRVLEASSAISRNLGYGNKLYKAGPTVKSLGWTVAHSNSAEQPRAR